MAEVEFAGVKFKGGKMVAVLMAGSTLIGGLYGAFEVYKDYQNMKKKIASYTAPDLSGFDKRISLIQKQLKANTTRVGEIQTIARDTRQDTRADAASLHLSLIHI